MAKPTPTTAAQPTSTDVHVDAPLGKKPTPPKDTPNWRMKFLSRLRELLKEKVEVSVFDAAVKTARSHTGGKAKAARRQAYDPWMSPLAMPAMDEGDDMDDDCCCPSDDTVLFQKADPRVNYKAATTVGTSCQDCQNFCEEDAACRLIEGTISELAVCDLFQAETEDEPQPTPMRELADVAAKDKPWRLFNESHSLMEPPATIAVLPKPGVFKHPSYGEINISPERNAQFVANFKAGVYQSRLPIDAEHETKLSGAVGWITDLNQATDGHVEATVEWTDRGVNLLRGNRFSFISPEWFDSWTAPDTGEAHQDVLIGAAITTRPFFKDSALRPLVASERGLAYLDPASSSETVVVFLPLSPAATHEEVRMSDTSKGAAGAAPADLTILTGGEGSVMAGTVTAEATKTLSERLTAAEAERDALKAAAATAQATSKTLSERLEKIEREGRRKRFTDEVTGRSSENGAAWYGPIDKHVGMLETLAEAFGEDSEQLTSHVAMQRASAAALKQSGIFSEIGTDASGSAGGNPQERINRLAQARATEKSITFREAIAQIASEQPDLYREAGEFARVKV